MTSPCATATASQTPCRKIRHLAGTLLNRGDAKSIQCTKAREKSTPPPPPFSYQLQVLVSDVLIVEAHVPQSRRHAVPGRRREYSSREQRAKGGGSRAEGERVKVIERAGPACLSPGQFSLRHGRKFPARHSRSRHRSSCLVCSCSWVR